MFAMFKICAILALAAPLASALAITSVTGNAVSEGSLTISWTTSTSDPAGTFSIELNHPSFNNALAIGNNVDASSLSDTVALPNVPADSGYWITFVDISNINSIFAQSQTFSIGAVSATQSVTVKGSSTASSKSASNSNSVSGSSASTTGVPLSTKPLPSTTGFGTTGSATPTSAASSAGPSTTPSTGAALATRSVVGGSLSGALLVALGVVAGAFVL
ncbi:hypothetical protein B0H13DRAFT_2004752 [Mycena leptocephala]|nr:hypothetical protein B0H13DRAFT_2004752 [Mycena leptocephala]